MPLKVIRRADSDVFYIRGTIQGRRYTETTGTTDKKLANEYRLKREHEIHRENLHGRAATKTFAEAAMHYVEHGGEAKYVRILLSHIGSEKLTAIKQEQIDRIAGKLYPVGKNSTKNRHVYSPMSAVLHHAAHLGWCEPPVIRRPKQPAGRVRWLEKWDAQQLVAAAAPHLKPLLYFLFFTGARVGEALWLDWANLDLERKHVQFLDTKNGTNRGVPLHRDLVRILERFEHRSGTVFLSHKNQPYTLPKGDNDKSAGTRIKTSFQAAVRRAGLKDFHPHDCRHTWATWHYKANHDLGALMKLGGWKTMSMVMRYAHTNVDELSHTIEAL